MKRWLSQLTLLLLSHFCLAQTTIVTIDSAVCQSAMPIVWNNEQVTLPPDFDFSTPVITINDTVHFADGHDSVTILNLTVNPSYLIDTFATACDVFIWYGVPFFSSRTYTRYGSTIHSCDSTIKLHLTINPSYSFDTAKVVCDSLLWAPHKFTQSTDTTLHYLSTKGCDSIYNLSLVVNHSSFGDTTADECDSFTWYGTTYTSSGSPTHLIVNTYNCDSTITLHLSLRYSTTSTILEEVLENDLPHSFNSLFFNNEVTDEEIVLPNTAGCDSVISYSLTIHHNQRTELDTSVCANHYPIVWQGITFNINSEESQKDSLLLSTTAGADSTVVLTVYCRPTYHFHFHDTICSNQSYLFENQTFSESGDYDIPLQTNNYLCDSTRTLHLTVYPSYLNTFYDTACSNETYVWGSPQRQIFVPDANLATTTYTVQDQFLTLPGCDSILTLELTVLESYDLHFHDTICEAQFQENGWSQNAYPFENIAFNSSTDTTFSFTTTVHQCDSSRTLHLVVNPTYQMDTYDTVLQGESITFEGRTFSETGTYSIPFNTHNGNCDSVQTLHLLVVPITLLDTTICRNQLPIVWHGITFDSDNGSDQTLTDLTTVTTVGGTDSILMLTVNIHDTSTFTDSVMHCGFYTWIDGIEYQQSTDAPSLILQNANVLGCDSVINLHLELFFSQRHFDTLTVCDSLRWRNGETFLYDTTNVRDTVATSTGCDTIFALELTVLQSSHTELSDSVCYHTPYSWHGNSIAGDTSGIFTFRFDTVNNVQCDSTTTLTITKLSQPEVTIETDIDCHDQGYRLTAQATAARADGGGSISLHYIRWSSYPYDSLLDGNESNNELFVSPQVNTEYMLYADYREAPLCPVTTTTTLKPIETPTPELMVTPEALNSNNLRFTAHDITHATDCERTWYLNGIRQTETGATLNGTAMPEDDSVVVALEHFDSLCHDTAVHVLRVNRVNFFVPNVFTPSRETNNRFVFITQGFLSGEIFIYNREGLLVYHSDDYSTGWDGQSQDGTPCPQGNYVWKLVYRAVDLPHSDRIEAGSVLLLR